MITINYTKTEETARINYNKLAFNISTTVRLMDLLEGTTGYKQEIKNTGNRFLKLLIDYGTKHYLDYENAGDIGYSIKPQDVYNITDKAYYEIMELSPHEVVVLNNLKNRLIANGYKLADIDIDYIPLNNDLLQPKKQIV